VASEPGHGTGVSAAERFTRRWVAMYTRRLPEHLRDERRAEIDSDLWEHHAELDDRRERSWLALLEVAGRTITGMPADLAWRSQQLSFARGASGVAPTEGTAMQTTETTSKYGYPTWLVVVAAAMAVLASAFGVGALLGGLFGGQSGEDEGMSMWGLFLTLDAATIAVGLLLASRAPIVSVVLVALGAVGFGILSFWMFFTLVAGAVVAIAALLCAPRMVRARPAA
jgi:hypothetical protein